MCIHKFQTYSNLDFQTAVIKTVIEEHTAEM